MVIEASHRIVETELRRALDRRDGPAGELDLGDARLDPQVALRDRLADLGLEAGLVFPLDIDRARQDEVGDRLDRGGWVGCADYRPVQG